MPFQAKRGIAGRHGKCPGHFMTVLIPAEQIPCVHFFSDIIKGFIIAIGDDAVTHLFEALQAVDYFAAEEGASIFQSRFVYNDGGSFPLDSRNTAKMQPEIRFLRLTRKQIRYKLTVTDGFMGCIMSSALICRATDPEIRDSFITKRRMIPMALVTSTEMFKKAYDGGYAIGAFNVNNMEIVQGITEAAQELKSPVILQASAGARKYANPFYLQKLVEAAVLTCPDIDIVMHLDHGPDFETCKSCVDSGFTSVMIDCSSKPFEENIAITKQVVEYAHAKGAVVEAELGALAGIEDDVNVSAADSAYTRPEEVQEFLIDKKLTPGHARAILSISDKDQQVEIATKVFDEKMTVRDTEKLVKSLGKPAKPKKMTPEALQLIYRQLEDRIREKIGAKVSIKPSDEKKGRIEIEYFTQEELEEVVNKITKEQ